MNLKTIKDIAKKNNFDISKFDINEIIMGMSVELEHGKKNPKTNITNDDLVKTFKIVMAHMYESPTYYTDLKSVENKSEKELTNEAKRFMSLAGIKEFDKFFLNNKIFKEGKEQKEEDEDFIIFEFERVYIPPGKDDEVYKIQKREI